MRWKKNFVLSAAVTICVLFSVSNVAFGASAPTPEPLLELLAREEVSCNKDIYITSLKFLEETKEIIVVYMETPGLLVTGTYKHEASASGREELSNRVSIYDVKIPPFSVRAYYMENAPRVNVLLEGLREFLKKQKTTWGTVK